MIKRTGTHIAFWVVIMIALTLYFGREGSEYFKSFFFVTFLLPVTMGTTYIFNYYLVPNYFLKKKYLKFLLYLLYTFVFSVYLQMLVLITSFIVLANYEYDNMLSTTVDITSLTITMYLLVLLVAFVKLSTSVEKLNREREQLTMDLEKNQTKVINIRSDRKNIPLILEDIQYIESLADYVKIITNNQQLITKEKISHLESKLPDHFVRIHRSYIINKDRIQSYNKENIIIQDQQLPVGRSYKKSLEMLFP